MPSSAISVFVTDDHSILCEGLVDLLNRQEDMQCVGSAGTAADTCSGLAQCHADVLLLDINLPDLSGVSLCEKVKRLYPGVSILAFSMYDDAKVMEQMLRKGASGYLIKSAPYDELLQAIRTVAAGHAYLSTDVFEGLIAASGSAQRRCHAEFLPVLTRREKEVLELLGADKTSAEIAGELFVSLHTVESHKRNLLIKFGAKNSVGLIKAAVDKGYL